MGLARSFGVVEKRVSGRRRVHREKRVGHRTLRVDSNTFRVGIAFSNQLAKRSEEIRERICASQATREREIRLAMYVEDYYHMQ